MHETGTRVRLIRSDEALTPPYQGLIEQSARAGFFQSHAWFDNFRRHVAPSGDRLRLYAVETVDGDPLAIVPALYSRLYDVHPRARVLHFLHPEGISYSPLAKPGEGNPLRALERVLYSLFPDRHSYDVLRFSPLERGSAFTDGLISTLRRTRHPMQIYAFPDDCYAAVMPGTSRDYLAGRPEPLRASIAEAAQILYAAGRAAFRLVQSPEEVDAGWEDYEKVFDQSGTLQANESAEYLPGIIRAAAVSGALRLGFIDLDGVPAAVQLWIVSPGVARCLRIFTIKRSTNVALTDLLTKELAVHFIDVDRVSVLAFGAIDRELTMNWATGSHARIGLAAFNLRTWRGMKGAARHVGAQYVKSFFRRR